MKPWSALRDAAISNREKVNRLVAIGCEQWGFCGGAKHARDAIGTMNTIDARIFAIAMIEAEGFPDAAQEVSWLLKFEQMFREIFGEGDVLLEAAPCP